MLLNKSVYDLDIPSEHDAIEQFNASIDGEHDQEAQQDRALLRDLHRVLMVLDRSARSQFTGNYTVYSILALLAVHEEKMNKEQEEIKKAEKSNPRDPRLRLRRLQPLTQTHISHLVGIRPQSLGSILLQMEEEGLIERTKHKEDRRALHVSLTDEGREYVSELKRSHDNFASTILKELSPEEKETMSRGLAKIMSALVLS